MTATDNGRTPEVRQREFLAALHDLVASGGGGFNISCPVKIPDAQGREREVYSTPLQAIINLAVQLSEDAASARATSIQFQSLADSVEELIDQLKNSQAAMDDLRDAVRKNNELTARALKRG
jgi:predicted DNA-binding ArsR family transcriptional regulator